MQQGVLTLRLRMGAGLQAADLNGSSEPYVQASIGAQRKQSRVAEKTLESREKTLDPEWNEELQFEGTLHELVACGLQLQVRRPQQLRGSTPSAPHRTARTRSRSRTVRACARSAERVRSSTRTASPRTRRWARCR